MESKESSIVFSDSSSNKSNQDREASEESKHKESSIIFSDTEPENDNKNAGNFD